MLDIKALDQLSQLKTDILASKEFALGNVVGTNGRFGFVRTEDGRDAFLSPEKMDRLLPGDKVKVSLVKNKQDKLEATLEELIESPTQRFIGTYRIKGKAHFVEPSIDGFKRWIFIPPQARQRCKEGDLIVVQLTRHPLEDGKAQAKVLERIGKPDDDKIEFKFTKAKYDLNRDFGPKEQAQLKEIESAFEDTLNACHDDFTDIPFVTIDSATTRDMDDALAIEKTEQDGNPFYTLTVAIADPTSFIEQGSALARVAQIRTQTAYMLGGVTPMLPSELSNNYFSLEEGKTKLALICKIDVDHTGKIKNSAFSFGKIQSQHKLAYDDVADFIEQDNAEAIPQTIQPAIQSLHELAKIRLNFRTQNNIIGQDQTDFDYQLSSTGKIEVIKAKPKNAAHKLVEEAMVATNLCAGELLAQHNKGIAVINEGFKKERLGEVKALLKEEEITPEGDIETLEGFMDLFKYLSDDPEKSYIASPLRRMTQFGHPSLEHKAHMGMGIAHYATVTSPIRRFVDLYNHWSLKSILLEQSAKQLSEKHLEAIATQIQSIKSAERELFQWLIVQYAQNILETEANGKIRIVTQQGFGVRVDENGVEGFVLFPKKTEKKYDAKRMTLTVGENTYRLDQDVKIKIASVDLNKKRIAFELV